MSAGVTKCHVGRIMCVRRIAPSLNAPLDRPIVEAGRPQSDRPFRARVVLRLHRAKPADHIGRRATRRADELLTAQPPGDRVDLRDSGAHRTSCRFSRPFSISVYKGEQR